MTRLFGKLVAKTESKMRAGQRRRLTDAGATDSEIEQHMAKYAINLPRLTLHGLRHVAASYMWDATGDILAVSKALRHSSPTVTSTVYAHMRGGKQRAVFGAIATTLATADSRTFPAHTPTGA